MRFIRNLFFIPSILLCLFFSAVQITTAQTGTAAISGQVTDSSGAVLQGATVELQNVQQGTIHTTTTNSAGAYIFPIIPPGQYSITVSKEGFKQVKLVGIVANVQGHVEQDVRLEVGSVSSSVQVSAGAAVINTTDASVSTVIDRHFVENLPLNGRSFQSLLLLTPGVTLNAGAGAMGANIGTTGQFIVNGQRSDANYWTVDGVSGNIGMAPGTPGPGAAGAIGATNAAGGTSALVSVDALDEFRVVTSTYAPEFGHAVGGQVVIQTRAGTNQFHGAIFDYLRNTKLDSTDWFANHYNLPKPGEVQNDFGGVLGGPIVKDKTFFFFSYEGLRLTQPFTQVSTVPTMAARAAAKPDAQPFINMYPQPAAGAPETAPGSGLALYTATFSNPSTSNAYSLRVDHQLTQGLHLFGRYNHSPSGYRLRGMSGAAYAANDINVGNRITKTATGGATWVISPELVNDIRLNYSVSGGTNSAEMDDFGGGTPAPSNGLPSPYTYGDSLFAFYPIIGTGMSQYRGLRGANYQRQWNLVDTLSVQRGNHSLKFGVDYRRLTPNFGQATYELIPLFFSIDSLQDGVSDLTVVSHYNLGQYLLQNVGVFGQDTWRVTPRLNLTYGLRWDVDVAPQTTKGIALSGLTGFDVNDLSNLALAPGTPAYHTRYDNIAPRIGGAYRVLTQPGRELVLRGGFGVFYGTASTQVINGYAMNEPLYPYGANAFISGVHFPILPGDEASKLPPLDPPSLANGNQLFGLDPDLNSPYAFEWNVAVEQSLGSAQTFTLSYIGSRDRRQTSVESISNPNPNYVGAYLVGDTGTASYSALQTQFQRRLSHGLQAIAAYTWSHCIDTGSYGAYANGTLADPDANRGDCDYDLRNSFSAAVTYQFPTLKNNLFTRAVTGGWTTDDIFLFFTGAPMDIVDGNFPQLSNTRAQTQIRPDVVPGVSQYLTGPQYPGGKMLNPAAFADPPAAYDPVLDAVVPIRQGTLSRNAVRALGLGQWNFAVHRDFPITEAVKLQFRAEFFNLLNHPNFGPFNGSFTTTNPLFGQSTQMMNTALGGNQGVGAQSSLYQPGGPRSGQLALKLSF